MVLCQRHGHEIVALANLLPPNNAIDDMDSYMYQTVGHQVIESYAECMNLPLYRRRIQGASKDQRLVYEDTAGDEVEDLAALLSYIKSEIPEVTAVSSGAIASDYQRTRVERVCSRLGLVSLAYMWHQPQHLLLRDMIETPINAILVKIAAAGLSPKNHLGASLSTIEPHLHSLKRKYGSNICGEGGEYETLTLDCPPLFTNGRLILDTWDTIIIDDNTFAPVALLHPTRFHLEYSSNITSSGHQRNAKVIDIPDEYTMPLQKSTTVFDSTAGTWTPKLSVQYQHTHQSMLHNNTPTARNATTVSVTIPGSTTQCRTADSTESALAAALDCIGKTLVSKLQSSWNDVIFIHLFIPRMDYFASVNKVYSQYLPSVNPPARATMQLAENEHLAMVVEVCLGVRSSTNGGDGIKRDADDMKRKNAITKKVLHVQSISQWAPSCIGPYSQAVLYQGLLHFAGQIPLDPGTMNVPDPLHTNHSLKCLENCQAVAIAMKCDLKKCMLWCSIYTSPGVKNATLLSKTSEGCLHEFLAVQTHSDDEHSDGESIIAIDDYARPPDIRLLRNYEPLLTYIEMPELPRGVGVEIQPVAWLKDDSIQYTSSALHIKDDDNNLENESNTSSTSSSMDNNVDGMPVWISRLESRNKKESLENGSHYVEVSLKSLSSLGYFARIQTFFYVQPHDHTHGGSTPSKSAVSAAHIQHSAFQGAMLMRKELADIHLAVDDVVSAKIHVACGAHDYIFELVDACQRAFSRSFSQFDDDFDISVTAVPVLKVAENNIDDSVSALFEIELLAHK